MRGLRAASAGLLVRFKDNLAQVLSPSALRLVGPILVEQTLLMLMSMVNSIMASHIGTHAVSAIAMVDSISNLVVSFFSALSVGATVVVAQFTGRGDARNARETVKQALYSALLLIVSVCTLMLVFQGPLIQLLYGAADPDVLAASRIYLVGSVLSYPCIAISGISNGILRGSGDTRTPMFVTLLMNVVSAALGYLLIYGIPIGPYKLGAIGIVGAVTAIAVARLCGSALLLVVLLRGNRAVKLQDPFQFRWNAAIQRSLFGIGIPASVENILFNFGKVITQTFLVASGTIAVASTFYMNSVLNLTNLPGNALNLATSTIIGQNMGSGDTDLAKRNMLNLVVLAVLILTVVTAAALPLLPYILRIYQPDASVIPTTTTLLYITLIGTVLFWPQSFIFPSALRATGDGKYCMLVSIISMWTLRVGGAYFSTHVLHMGAVGCAAAMVVDWVLRGSFFTHRVFSDRWKRNIVLRVPS